MIAAARRAPREIPCFAGTLLKPAVAGRRRARGQRRRRAWSAACVSSRQPRLKDSIAKSLGRYVGSVKTKARELNLILSRKVKAKKS